MVFLQHGFEQRHIGAACIQQYALAGIQVGKQIAHCAAGLVGEDSEVHNGGKGVAVSWMSLS